MKTITHGTRAGAVAFGIISLILGGCVDYAVDTTLNTDGSGTRAIRVDVTDPGKLEDFGLSPLEFRDVMNLSDRLGWDHEVKLQEDGDTVHVFRLEKRMATLGSWAEANGDIGIAGVPAGRARSKLGYLTLGDVQFQNRLWVRLDGNSAESPTLRYQEHFLWENGVEALHEAILEQMEGALQGAYPRLTDRERGEIVGYARASIRSAIDEGVLDASSDEQDRLWNRVLSGTASQGIKAVKEHYPSAQEESLRECLDVLSGDGETDGVEDIDKLLPGLSLAWNTQIEMRLTMPGRITTTNAHQQEGNTLMWEFSPIDALGGPIVLVAESVVGSGA